MTGAIIDQYIGTVIVACDQEIVVPNDYGIGNEMLFAVLAYVQEIISSRVFLDVVMAIDPGHMEKARTIVSACEAMLV